MKVNIIFNVIIKPYIYIPLYSHDNYLIAEWFA